MENARRKGLALTSCAQDATHLETLDLLPPRLLNAFTFQPDGATSLVHEEPRHLSRGGAGAGAGAVTSCAWARSGEDSRPPTRPLLAARSFAPPCVPHRPPRRTAVGARAVPPAHIGLVDVRAGLVVPSLCDVINANWGGGAERGVWA